MTVSLAPAPFFRQYDNNNLPLVGGQLFTYVAGTSTPQATWTDATQTQANTNPVILNYRGEASVWLASNLTYKLVLEDSSGNLLWSQDQIVGGLSASQILAVLTQSLLGQILYPLTAAEASAGVTPTYYFYAPGDVRRYGAVYDGVTDSTQAMMQACLVGGDIFIEGPLALSSSSLAALTNGALTLQSYTTIRFFGAGGTSKGGSITITGVTGCNVFYSLNQTNILIQNPVITGIGGTGVNSGTGYVWYCQANALATGNMYNCRMSGGTLTNFAGLYWVYFDNFAGVLYRMIGCGIDNVTCISQSGNCQGNSSQTITACIVGFSGSDAQNYYGIVEATVFGLNVYAQFIKQICIFWSGVARSRAYNNIVNSVGTDASISNDSICYAFLAYDHSHGSALPPDLIEFYDNDIQGVRDCGIYGAAANRIFVHGNIISGQISTANSTIPKGAIVLSGCAKAVVQGNNIDSCVFGVSGVVQTGNELVLSDTVVTGMVTNTIGMLIQPAGTGSVGSVLIDGYKAVGNATSSAIGLRFDSNSSIGIANFTLKNFEVESLYNGIAQISSDASVPALTRVSITNGVIRGCTNIGVQYQNCSNAATRSTLKNLEFQGSVGGAELLAIAGSLNLNIDNIVFQDLTTGSTLCWYGAGAQGTVTNVFYNNVASARRYSNPTDLAVQQPTWTGNDNDFVQNLNPTELGSASSKYVILGWVYDVTNAAWKQCRALTGN